MATLAEVQNEILKMQQANDERLTAALEKREAEMKNYMDALVEAVKGGKSGERAAEGKDKDHDKDYNKSQRQIFDDKFLKKLKNFN